MIILLTLVSFIVTFVLYCCLRVSSMESRREEREEWE